MKTKKKLIDFIFIVVSGGALIVLNQFGILERYADFALIPIIGAYFLGQYFERKFNKSKVN